MTKKPHKHAAIIKAWADGEEIEFRAPRCTAWVSSAAPAFIEDYEYRVKPAKQYPTTAAHAKLFANVYEETTFTTHEGRLVEVANFAIRHACDNGQVITREEFRRVSDEANKALRSLTAYGYTDEGGDLWKPPLGRRQETTMKLAAALRLIGTLDGKDKSSVIVIHVDGLRFTLGEYVSNVLKATGLS